jgi:hypothetical protein
MSAQCPRSQYTCHEVFTLQSIKKTSGRLLRYEEKGSGIYDVCERLHTL